MAYSTATPLTVWQVSGGTAERSFARLFTQHQVMLAGPGDGGAWRPGQADWVYGGPTVRRLAEEVQVGDVVLLRTGQATIHSVGIVAGGYEYLPQFDDVNGWDLQHGRRVRWAGHHQPYTFSASLFGGGPAPLSRVNQPELMDYARRFVQSDPTHWQSAPLPPLPPEEPPLWDVPPALAELVAHAADLHPLYWDGAAFGDPPAEHEMVAHFVVPLLRGLGWQVEQIGLEWRRIDVALFDRLPRSPENCRLVIEAKRLGVGVEGHLQQAVDYLTGLGIRRDVVVTDGLRYRLYAGDRGYEPVAYANLARLKVSSLRLFERLGRGG